MSNAFSDPEVRARAAAKSIATRKAKAEARKLETDTRRAMAPAQRFGETPVSPGMQEVEAALQTAAASLPSLDQMYEVPAARRADALDMKLASMKTGSGGKMKDAFVRRKAVSSDLTNDPRAYGSEERPRQVAGLAVDATEAGRIIVYDEKFRARAIPEQNFRAVLATGKLTFVCKGCGGEHLKEIIDPRTDEVVDVEVDYAYDACPSLPKAMKIRCPVCAARGNNMVITDEVPAQGKSPFQGDNEDEFVSVAAAEDETPRDRLMRLLHEHMAWRHPSEAVQYGVAVAAIRQATAGEASSNTALIR